MEEVVKLVNGTIDRTVDRTVDRMADRVADRVVHRLMEETPRTDCRGFVACLGFVLGLTTAYAFDWAAGWHWFMNGPDACPM